MIQYRCEGHFGVQTTKIQVGEWPVWPSDLQQARLRVINNSFNLLTGRRSSQAVRSDHPK